MDWHKDLGFNRDNPNFGEICPFRLGPKRILCFKSRKFTELSPKLEPIFFPKWIPEPWIDVNTSVVKQSLKNRKREMNKWTRENCSNTHLSKSCTDIKAAYRTNLFFKLFFFRYPREPNRQAQPVSRSNSQILFVGWWLRLLVEGDDRRGPLLQRGLWRSSWRRCPYQQFSRQHARPTGRWRSRRRWSSARRCQARWRRGICTDIQTARPSGALRPVAPPNLGESTPRRRQLPHLRGQMQGAICPVRVRAWMDQDLTACQSYSSNRVCKPRRWKPMTPTSSGNVGQDWTWTRLGWAGPKRKIIEKN